MKLPGVLMAIVAALVLAAPASAMHWLDDPGHTISVPTDFTIEATGPTTAVPLGGVSVDPDEPFSCAPTSVGLGTTLVTCSAPDANNATFNVTVQDTTAPVVTVPGDINTSTTGASANVDFTPAPSATDTVSGSITPSCTPPAGSFPVGTTQVTCTATDGSGNIGSASFAVHVADVGPPTITSTPSDVTAEATGPGGAAVGYSPPGATDNADPAPTVGCSPGPGSTFVLGTTPVSCTAHDASGNASSPPVTFNVTVRDTTPPSLTLPGSISVEADSTAGKVVTYTASATDLVSGAVTPNCSPASGSTFAVGTTTVSCTATDGAGKQATGSFQVTVTDASGPVFSSVPGTLTAEANGPAGAVVSYTTPTAVDVVDGPQPVSCSPLSQTLFHLGTTTVNCTASDNHGNSTPTSFQISVVDTTPPTLAIPGPTTVYATTPTGIPETASAFIAFRRAASADDIVDPNPQITDNLGSFVGVGTQDVGFVARDASGNFTAKSTTFTVLPMPPAGTKPLPLPPPAKLPADVPNLRVTTGSGFVRLVWGTVPGAAQYLVYRSQNGARRLADGHGDLIYKGPATTYTDRGLTNGVEYRYVVVSEDAAGNQSAGVGTAAVPRLNLLRTPKDGAKLKKAPKLVWSRNAEADYYNVQVFRGQVKILSTWPIKSSFQLKRAWKYQGKKYTLGKGVYRWYVWPGFGARSAVDYGDLMGSNSFQMLR